MMRIEFAGSYASGKSTVAQIIVKRLNLYLFEKRHCSCMDNIVGLIKGRLKINKQKINLQNSWKAYLASTWSIDRCVSLKDKPSLIDQGSISHLWSLYCRDVLDEDGIVKALKAIPLPDYLFFFHASTVERLQRNLTRKKKKQYPSERVDSWLLHTVPDLVSEGLSASEIDDVIGSVAQSMFKPPIRSSDLITRAQLLMESTSALKAKTDSDRVALFRSLLSKRKISLSYVNTTHRSIEQVVSLIESELQDKFNKMSIVNKLNYG